MLIRVKQKYMYLGHKKSFVKTFFFPKHTYVKQYIITVKI